MLKTANDAEITIVEYEYITRGLRGLDGGGRKQAKNDRLFPSLKQKLLRKMDSELVQVVGPLRQGQGEHSGSAQGLPLLRHAFKDSCRAWSIPEEISVALTGTVMEALAVHGGQVPTQAAGRRDQGVALSGAGLGEGEEGLTLGGEAVKRCSERSVAREGGGRGEVWGWGGEGGCV